MILLACHGPTTHCRFYREACSEGAAGENKEVGSRIRLLISRFDSRPLSPPLSPPRGSAEKLQQSLPARSDQAMAGHQGQVITMGEDRDTSGGVLTDDDLGIHAAGHVSVFCRNRLAGP